MATLDVLVHESWRDTRRLPIEMVENPHLAGEVIDAIPEKVFEQYPDLKEELLRLKAH